jgi:hypothetical protein
MAKLSHQRALDILVHRCGEWSQVTLRDGKVCAVFDVGWGYDLGQDVAHITTNCSPGPDPEDVEFPFECDFFLADQISRIVDLETNALLFDLEEPK